MHYTGNILKLQQSRVHLKRLIVAHLVKNSPLFMQNQRSIPILGQVNPVHALGRISLRSIVIYVLASTSKSSKCSLKTAIGRVYW